MSIGSEFPNRIVFGNAAVKGSGKDAGSDPASPAEYSTRKPESALPSTLQDQLKRQHE